MNKKVKLLIFLSIAVVSSVTAVYAVSLINASDVIYDNKKSGSQADNVQGAIDDLYDLKGGGSSSGTSGSKRGTNLISYITNLAKTDTTNLAYDDTSDKNLRYIGNNPNNYVLFNNELWRIIGVMNNVKDADGNSASRVKLIRAESIGEYSYDNKPAGTGSSLTQWASDDWTDSRLMEMLNSGSYWNRENGSCPYDWGLPVANRTTPCDMTTIGLTDESKSMITSVLYYLGSPLNHQSSASTFYTKERSNTTANNRPTTWIGYVGLMYPSDYGYAVGGTVKSTCLNSTLDQYKTNNCNENNWNVTDDNEYAITLAGDSRSTYTISKSQFSSVSAFWAIEVRPVVYLNTDIKKTGGSGTSDDPYTIANKGTNYDDSNAAPPNLDEEEKLIPITLASDGKVTMISEDDEDWYNYGEKQWANAVILIDSPSKTYKEGDVISESDIESYFVWIPKYKYRLWNTGSTTKSVHEIDVVFDTEDTKDVEGTSCKTPMTSGSTGNCNNGEYMTHPAFISLGVDGFWVAKFEMGYKGANSRESAQVSSTDSSKIIIKPNVYSWRNNSIYSFFVSAYNYERDLDSHMIKNTEWGAVAILSHSKYGINAEVNINNNSSGKTGYSSLLTIDQHTYPGTYGDGSSYNQAYNTEIGYLASTTGNITGVYDMSGGTHEYMAAYVDGYYGKSGFTSSNISSYDKKYFDIYNAKSSVTNYQYRILGDATSEMGPIVQYTDGDGANRYHNNWYGDFFDFPTTSNPWWDRGGTYTHGGIASQFSIHIRTGEERTDIGTRLVLSF